MCMSRAEMERPNSVEPEIRLAQNFGLGAKELNETLRLILEHENEIRNAWNSHFGS